MTMPTILVTGASSGLGKDCARALVKEGYEVFGAARRLEQMADIKALGVRTIRMDVTDEEEMKACVAQIEGETGGIDILINNAGFSLYGAMEETPIEDARRQFDVNFFGMARLTQLVLPIMRKKRAGRIINVSSLGGKFGLPMISWYIASKFAIEGFSDCLRMELGQFGIDVVVVEPGGMATEFGDLQMGQDIESCTDGAYRELAAKYDAWLEKQYAIAPLPAEITRGVIEAVKARKPKTRYPVGQGAKSVMLLRKYGSDRLFDKIMMNAINKPA